VGVIKRESLDRVNGEEDDIDIVELEGITGKQSIEVFDLVGYADPTLVVELRSRRRHFALPWSHLDEFYDYTRTTVVPRAMMQCMMGHASQDLF
jgi:hypothetical protein